MADPAAQVHPVSRYDRVPQGIACYGVGEWDRALGNHRAVLRAVAPGDVAYAWLPWRRRDAFPQAKGIVVVDAHSGRPVDNVVVATCNREYGELVFEPTSGPGSTTPTTWSPPPTATAGSGRAAPSR